MEARFVWLDAYDGWMDAVKVRVAGVEDAAAVAALSGMLGYPASVEAMRGRLAELAGERVVYVAEVRGEVVGWADAAVERHLQGEAAVVLGGLVVRDEVRGRGVGRRLCAAVEAWAAGIGVGVVRVRSQMKRVEAHRFYLREGYEQVKVSGVFEKRVL